MSALLPLMRQLSIVDKKIGVVRFEPNWAQLRLIDECERQLRDRGRIRLIILKARQLGMSTVSEALAFQLLFMVPHYRAMILANKEKSAQNILNMTKLFWETSPYRRLYNMKYNSRNDLAWRETNSSIKIATAGRTTASDIGRSDTLHFLHASEVGFWFSPEEVMLSIDQTMPMSDMTACILESTANGIGNYFERTWKEATAGEVEYVPMFFSWLDHYEYTASYAKIDATAPLGPLDDEERALKAIGADKDQIVWRRWMIRNKTQGDPLKFAQEYPATPEQAFIATGTNVFSYPLLRAAYEEATPIPGTLIRNGNQVTFTTDPTGQMLLYKAPNEHDADWSQYVVAGDPTHRTRVGNDFAAAQVFNRRTLEQVAVWRGKVDPGTFGARLWELGMYYNTALVSSEVEGPASAAIGALQAMNYPRIYHRARPDATPGKQGGDIWGWMTTMQSKHFMMGIVKKYLSEQSITLHDAQTFSEMRDYITDEDGKMRPADTEKGYDDMVMSAAQALACHFLEGPLMPYGTGGHTFQPVSPWGDGPPPWESWEQGAA